MELVKLFGKLVIPLIGLYILFTAYSYADNLDQCKCVDELKPAIDHIKTVEQILFFFQMISILVIIASSVMDPKKIFDKIPKFAVSMGVSIYFIFILFIMIYFVNNVYEFGTNLPEDCDCALTWQRDILYIQASLYAFSLLIIGILFLILML